LELSVTLYAFVDAERPVALQRSRMGSDPGTSVVDGNQRSHDHQNLYLLGSGVFPSVGTANPTLTIAALTLMAAEAILKTL
jgi:choline dehydrogenase-like flavoprotein